MKTFHITLNVQVDAKDEEEAMEIAEVLRLSLLSHSPYKIEVEADDVEEL